MGTAIELKPLAIITIAFNIYECLQYKVVDEHDRTIQLLYTITLPRLALSNYNF